MTEMKCGMCGSDKVMSNLQIRDYCEVGEAKDLEVEVKGNPDALIFKQPHREALRATVCGECGNVGISVENPKTLWEVYIQQKDA